MAHAIDPSKRAREHGASMLLFMFVISLLLIPLMGLAIDGAVVFWVRAKLTAAVDAAALAGGRSINIYYSSAQNSGTAVTVAQEWFAANYPSGWLGTAVVGGTPSVTIQPTQTATQQVNVSASVTVPLYFMRLLGKNSITIGAAAQSARRNLNLLLVLDRSGSMGPAPTGSNACPTMIAAAQNFVNMFTDGFDNIGLITFSSTANSNPIDYGPTTYFKSSTPSLSTTLGNISCTGATSTAQALNVAYQSIQSTDMESALNVVVLFTDGQPNEVVYNGWPIKTKTDTRNDPNTWTPTVVGKSSCDSGITLNGGLTIGLVSGTQPSNTGYTVGLFDTSSRVAINAAPGLSSGSDCAFTTLGFTYVRDDVAYIPDSDAYGNATNSGYKGAPDTFTSGNYHGHIRDDEQIPGVMAAAFNAADNQATTMRNDTTYTIVIYTIGLDGAPDVSIDSTFLERLANDPRSPIYDSTKPAGYYAYAKDASALNQAFYQVASQVLRLSR
jgi:Flp pilus assembly protein TadG